MNKNKDFTVTTMEVTPELAQRWIDERPYGAQRPLRDKHIITLATAMENGEFGSNVIQFCKDGKDTQWLVNGQHTLRAMVKANVTLRLPIQTFPVKDEFEVATHYTHIDSGRNRNWADKLRVFGLETELGMTWSEVNLFSVAVRKIISGLSEYSDASFDETLNNLHKWKIYAKKYTGLIIETDMAQRLRRSDLYAIGMITLRYQEEMATEFWSQVARDDGLKAGDPRKTLRNYVSDSHMRTGHSKGIRANEAIRGICFAWNAWMEGRTLDRIVVRNPGAPIVLVGTPYK